MPLQDLPCVSSMLSESSGVKKRRSRGCLSDGPHTESTPTELIQQWSPPHKHPRVTSKGKENDDNHFVLARRSRRKKESPSGISWDHLPDELLLRIYFYLPLQDLLRISVVCKRWNRLVFDESLWHSVDLEGLTHMGPALQEVLKTRVRRLRCPRAFVEELQLTSADTLQVAEMDLSSSIIPTSALESIICRCRLLEYLSLEGLQLSDNIINSIAKNPNLQQLNLSGCSSFSASALAEMLKSCYSIDQLNISWCSFSNDHVKSIVNNLSPSVTSLNLSGYRESLTLDDEKKHLLMRLDPCSHQYMVQLTTPTVYTGSTGATLPKSGRPAMMTPRNDTDPSVNLKVLVERCPQIRTLDLSDSTLLMADSFPVLRQLRFLQHLSLSRCYHIHLAALTDLGKTFPALCLLDVFGLVQDSQLSSLKKEMSHVSVNSRPFSGIARPTPASRLVGSASDRTMWSRKCRLRFRL